MAITSQEELWGSAAIGIRAVVRLGSWTLRRRQREQPATPPANANYDQQRENQGKGESNLYRKTQDAASYEEKHSRAQKNNQRNCGRT